MKKVNTRRKGVGGTACLQKLGGMRGHAVKTLGSRRVWFWEETMSKKRLCWRHEKQKRHEKDYKANKNRGERVNSVAKTNP